MTWRQMYKDLLRRVKMLRDGDVALDMPSILNLFPELTEEEKGSSLLSKMRGMSVGDVITEPSSMGRINTARNYASALKSYLGKRFIVTTKYGNSLITIKRVK